MSISSDYLSLTRSTNGMAGMVSGLDTDSLVEALLMGQQSKIDKANQSYTLLEWKQESYRDVISAIDTFSSNFTSYSSSTSLISNSFFNQMTSSSSSSCFNVTGTSSAVDGEMRMKINQLATTSTISGGSIETVDKITGTLNESALASCKSSSVSFDFTNGDDETTRIELTEEDIEKLFKGDEIVLEHEDGTEIKFNIKDGKFQVETDDSLTGKVVAESDITDEDDEDYTGSNTTSLGLAKLGLTSTSTTGSYEVTNDSSITSCNGFYTTAKESAELSLSFNLDGVSKDIAYDDFVEFKTVSVEDVDDDGLGLGTYTDVEVVDMEQTLKNLESKLDSLFGSGNITLDYDTTDGSFSISAMSGRQITITGSADLLAAMDIESGDTNVLYGGNTVSEIFEDVFNSLGVNDVDEDGNKCTTITLNGVEIEINETDTISNLLSKVNDSDAGVTLSFDSYSSTFSLQANESGAGFDIDVSGDPNGNALLSAVMGVQSGYTIEEVVAAGDNGLVLKDSDGSPVTDGQGNNVMINTGYSSGVNAEFELNGITSERGSNTFTINGVTFELTAVHDKDDPADSVTTSRDVDSVMEGITSFVDEYNALIDTLNDLVNAKYDSEYPPLTDAQKDEMTDTEIANWEEKAKTGLLANDDLITDYLSAMRSTMYSTYGETALWQIGIEASDDWTENGKLYIDEDKLRQTLMEDPDTVRELFAGSDGLVSAVADVCKTYANTSSGSPGLLVEKAGVADTATEYNNTMYSWMEDILSRLEKLEYNYTLQSDRYWAAFNNMEVVLSGLSSQSAWLSQQFAY